MSSTTRTAAWRLLTPLIVLALLASAFYVAQRVVSAGEPAPADSLGLDYYINYAAPHAEPSTDGKEVKGKDGVYRPAGNSAFDQAMAIDRKFAAGNPRVAEQLAKIEAKANKTGQSPRQIKQAKGMQEAQLLTILVEFNDAANDDFTGSMVPETVFESRTCVPGNIQNGPLHNNITDPSTYTHDDNNTMWVPDFSPEHFNKLLYTHQGITERVRPDLTGPDGEAGIDISGYTMKNMYEEMSKGAYTVDGAATEWIEVPHSEGWYGASRCTQNAAGVWVAPIPQAMNGHPNNPGGASTLGVDAINALAAAEPDFPWADYDIEDQADADEDGDVFEPDGIIDHLVLVHSGEDKSGGGGAQGVYAIWAHSSTIPGGGYLIPGTDLRVANYIVQPEDSGVGVFAHEYGHDLGLPDLYDTSGAGESQIDFWDLMSTGSHSGPIFQSLPAHMGIWDKWIQGWAEPLMLNPGDDPQAVQLGQSSNTPRGTRDGIKINLPDKVITLADPHSGAMMWYSGADQDWADVRLARTIQVPDNADARFNLWNNYVIEADWDFGFVEISTDGGTTWSEQKVFTGNNVEVSTPDNYPDPNGRMHDYGDKKYGLTGDSHGWRLDYVPLGAFAGDEIMLRLRLATDEAFLERGWFADDFSVTAGGATVWSDDAETDGDWAATVDTFTDTTGAGWHRDSGTSTRTHYYMAEWRNFDGFDEGLQYTYDSTYLHDAWKVEKIKYNAPGMLVWYRDTT